MMGRRSGASVVAMALSLSACSLLVDFDDLHFIDTGGSGGAGGGGGPAFIIYVSANGSDDNDGLSMEAPKLTVKAAIDVARSLPGLAEIDVCAGSYPETGLHIEFPVVLLGGFDCGTWMRTGVETVLAGQPNGDTSIALELIGTGVTSETRVDGLKIEGTSLGRGRAVGVRVTDGAAPHISNNKIVGGGGALTGLPGSTAVIVNNQSAPELDGNEIDGGAGYGGSSVPGSVGISIIDSSPVIHDNVISGGTGVNAVGGSMSIGVWCLSGRLRDVATLRANEIDGGRGTMGGSAPTTIGVELEAECEAAIESNTITGGSGPGLGGPRGVLIRGALATTIHGNRIYSGDGNTIDGSVAAVEVETGTNVELVNNMILGAANPVSEIVYGVRMQQAGAPLLQHNTIVASVALNTFGIFMDEPVQNARLENNLIFSFGIGPSGDGVFLGCNGSFDGLHGNLIFGFGNVVGFCTTPYATFDSIHSNFPGIATLNLAFREDCTGESACVIVPWCDTLPNGCVDDLLDDWMGNGLATLVGPGWKLSTGGPCELSRSAFLTITPVVTTDFYEAVRTAPHSPGAHELDDPACAQ